MKWLAFLALLGALLFPAEGSAQAPVKLCITTNGVNCIPVDSSNPLPVTGALSILAGGFPGTQTTGTPILVTTGGVSGTLPAGLVVVASNVGITNAAYCKLGALATTSDQYIGPGGWFAFTVGTATQLTCITSTSTTTVNMVGGAGIPTGAVGGAGSTGISEAIFNTTLPTYTNGQTTQIQSGSRGSQHIELFAHDSPNAIDSNIPADASLNAVIALTTRGFNSLFNGTTWDRAPGTTNGAYGIIRDAAGNARGANVNASNQLSVSIDGTNTITLPTLSTTSSAALAANTVINSGAASLYSFNVSADSTLSGAAWWIMVYNATSAPADGAVTPQKCYAMANGTTSFSAAFPNPAVFGTGITIGVSTTGCFTKTASTHAFISGDYK